MTVSVKATVDSYEFELMLDHLNARLMKISQPKSDVHWLFTSTGDAVYCRFGDCHS